ncbi:aminotransferase class I/II-fold pyridoxal phosphate-dependent enzyme [Neolewinella sp.]|uniref:aminotransferase class I/II-fold pyridoxal phosphate-dependent enzyme n=1 Tax=Neolewinella sp. TaxID=2993543 RepID=UPI003B52991B
MKRVRLLITRGSQHAFQLVCTLLFAGGGVLAVAELTYGGITQLAEQLEVEVIRMPLDADGLDVGAFANHPRLAEIRAVYVTPHHQYPTTVTLTAERRIQLLELARTHSFAILEDDYDYDFYYERPPQLPLAALDRGAQVIYIGSFTKVLAPNLRVGFASLEEGELRTAVKVLGECYSSV